MGRFAALSRREDFRRTMTEGRRAAREGVSVFVRRRSEGGEVRLGCVVRARGAVARNRARRRVRAALAAAGAPDGLDVVVRVEAAGTGTELGFQEMVEMLRRVCNEARYAGG